MNPMLRDRLRTFFFASPVLALIGAAMVIDLIVCVFGLLTDHTIITGLPAWDKPTKFAISTGIYALSLVVIIRYTSIWKRTLRVVEVLTGLALILEIVLIDLQAARHTTSHFNIATPFDTHVFVAMGTGIGVLWVSAIVLTLATFRTHYKTPTWTIAVRYGMLLAVLGAGTGAFMAPPSHAQLAEAQKTHHITISGSHTVGGPDGGRGLPVLGWSTLHGDVRVAHFTGLHGLQVLAIIAWALSRQGFSESRKMRVMSAAVVSYASLFSILLAEALLRDPITDHNRAMISIWLLWLTASCVGLVAVFRSRVDDADLAALSKWEATV